MFSGKAGTYLRWVNYTAQCQWLALSLAHKYYTKNKVLDICIHTSLYWYGKNTAMKSFIIQAPMPILQKSMPKIVCGVATPFVNL
jgi:hypothetical protein